MDVTAAERSISGELVLDLVAARQRDSSIAGELFRARLVGLREDYKSKLWQRQETLQSLTSLWMQMNLLPSTNHQHAIWMLMVAEPINKHKAFEQNTANQEGTYITAAALQTGGKTQTTARISPARSPVKFITRAAELVHFPSRDPRFGRLKQMKARTSGQKKKRACSEWRRARSRVAARSRREREGSLFEQLLMCLPLPPPLLEHLDKASVVRLALCYLRLRALLDAPADRAESAPRDTPAGRRPVTVQCSTPNSGCEVGGASCVDMALGSALDGFMLLLSQDGLVIYTTEAISTHTGIKQVDLIGHSLYDFMHPCDQQEAREILSSKSGMAECQKCDLFFRMRCTLTPQRQNVGLKCRTWKVFHCAGVRKASVPAGLGCLILLCQSLPVLPSSAWDSSLHCMAFLSKHSPDMRFTYCQPRVFQLTGYTESDLLGHSVYQYYHASDCQHVHKAHLSLFSKGQTSTGKYRLLVKHGGYVWVETVATVMYNDQTGQLQSVICINYVLSGVEQSEVVFSMRQMECLLSSSPAPSPALPLQSPTLHDELSKSAAASADLCDSSMPGDSTWTRGLNGTVETDYFTTCHDLETLAPYIPMDGEDFLLFPLSDVVEGAVPDRKEVLNAFPLPFPFMESQNPACPLTLLSHSWVPPTPPMTSQRLSEYYLPKSHNQQHAVPRRPEFESRCGHTHRSGEGWRQVLHRHRTDTHLPPGANSQAGPPSLPPQHSAPPWREAEDADLSYSTNCTSCWWSPGCVGVCRSVPWAPGRTTLSINTTNLELPTRDLSTTVLVSCAPVLPVLSRYECEVNAPLDPSSCLLRGSEILSVLDQATSRLPA
ncbi:hypothetical protein GJAV_G00126690 [Gymnothorax javanicus]|nr:hypothetical protein GJAV_G00126690 [Gymnothorax javanicus]